MKGSTQSIRGGRQRFKPYPAYKESGVEWLGEIPAGWNLKRLKRIVVFRGGGTPSKDNLEYWEGDIPWVSPKDMKVSVVEETEDKITTEAVNKSATKLVPASSVLIVVRSGILIHTIPVALAGRDVTLNQDLKALIPASEIEAKFLMYLIAGMQRALLVEWKKEGATVESLELDLVADTPIPLPKIPEQCAIAAFLDRETARIDALIAKKERLIELLQEQRTALITRAVTKGLDPNVPMKDSGVEWLREIPGHWESAKMWRISSAISGGTPTKEDPRYWGGEIPWVSPKDMKRRFIDFSEDTIADAALRETGLKLLSPLAVLIVVRGMILAHSFPVAVTRVPVTINQDMKAFRFRRGISPLFVAWLFEGIGKVLAAAVVEEAAHGTRAIRMDQWRSVSLPIPPESEQLAIISFLDRETARIDALVAKVRAAIAHLKELRTALISAAVTGKIDVRKEIA